MKDFLKKLIADKKAELTDLQERSNKSEDINEVRSIGNQIDKINKEIRDAEAQLSDIEDNENIDDVEESRNAFDPSKALNVVATTNMNTGGQARDGEDKLSSMEYRKAFKTYAQTGERTETLNKILLEVREEGEVTSKELGVLIPHTVLQELIKKIEGSYGTLSSKVRMLNVPGGVEIPIGEFDAEFTWSGSEGTDTEHGVSKEQKVKGVTGSVTFSYYIGEIRIAESLLQSILTVDAFEKELVEVMYKAYLKARDLAVVKGTGTGQPTGITTDVAAGLQRVPEANIIEFTEDEIANWTAWEKKLFAIIPIGMEGESPEFAMAKQTYVSNLCTMKDSNGQPINKAAFDVTDKQYKFNEYPVTRTEQDLFKSFDTAGDGDFFGMFWVPQKAYGINSNMTFGYKRYFDDDKNKWINKGLVILDGKPLNTDYIYLLKKKVTG